MAGGLRSRTLPHRSGRLSRSLMEQSDFYSDRKFCAQCNDYVSYLQSMEHSYCTTCGEEVRLFSEQDWEAFNESLKERKPKGGRPKKKDQQDKESA